ncbi:hypothetical protein ACJJTC_003691 [Scirpophaga incertulas]
MFHVGQGSGVETLCQSCQKTSKAPLRPESTTQEINSKQTRKNNLNKLSPNPGWSPGESDQHPPTNVSNTTDSRKYEKGQDEQKEQNPRESHKQNRRHSKSAQRTSRKRERMDTKMKDKERTTTSRTEIQNIATNYYRSLYQKPSPGQLILHSPEREYTIETQESLITKIYRDTAM